MDAEVFGNFPQERKKSNNKKPLQSSHCKRTLLELLAVMGSLIFKPSELKINKVKLEITGHDCRFN